MHGRLRLPAVVIGAAAIATAGLFALALLEPRASLTPEPETAQQVFLLLVLVFLPVGVASYWTFSALRGHYARRRALSASIAFAVSAPFSLCIGLMLAQIPGSYADNFLGPPFGLIGAFVGIIIVAAVLSFVPTALALRLSG